MANDENYMDLLEPEKLYKTVLKDAFHKNAEDYFYNLKDQANTDTAANRATCDHMYALMKKLEQLKAKRSKKKGLMIFCIIMGAIITFAGLTLLIYGITHETFEHRMLFIMLGIFVGILGGLTLIILPCVLIKPKIKALDQQIAETEKQIGQKKNEAYAQMASLNHLYDWGIPATLVSKTTPLIQMDKTFNPTRFYQLHDKYGFGENTNKNRSSVYVQSGTILGNPFLMQRNFCTEMNNFTYTGSIVISWTTTYSDKNGIHTTTHTQTLTATVTKPKPDYFHDTWLVYGNDAAPKLSFSRQPSKANSMSEKEIDKLEKNFEKDLQKMQEKKIKTSNFTAMANSEFEALFHALDRDNEVEFRLLFTPLAQKSMLQLIESKKPYGDDFIFQKKKCLNYIKSRHSQGADYDGNPAKFIHYDFDKAKEYFLNYMDNYFQSFYYDLAPLLCIPLYQQHKATEYIYKDVLPRNVTSFESEVMANQFDPHQFMPAECKTDVILKSELIKKAGNSDIVNIHAYGYDRIEHITYVPKMGGDGRWHDVPVKWYEYIPCEKETPIQIQNINTNKQQYNENMDKIKALLSPKIVGNAIITQRGLFSSILMDQNNSYNSEELNNILSRQEE